VHSLLNIWAYGSIYGAYYFLGLCEHPVNSGIASSLFSSSLVFVAILFYFNFGQKLSYCGMSGIGLIIGAVCLISMSAGMKPSSTTDNSQNISGEDKDTTYVQLSIVTSLCAGLSFACASLYGKTIIVKYDIDLAQWQYDTNGLFGLVLLVPYIWLVYSNQLKEVSMKEIGLSMATYILSNTGALFSYQSIKYGKAGVVQGIENLKVVWLTIMMSIIQGQLPTHLQTAGIITGLVGALVILADRAT
jgi:drug/metabolite transporter (DMT)-like permease